MESSGGMQGPLRRRNMLYIWVRRYAVLTEHVLVIYKNVYRTSVDMEIAVDSTTTIEPVDHKGQFKFVINSSGVITFLQTEDAESLIRWILAIRGSTFTSIGLSMDDFEIISVIGRGFHGKVMLVKRVSTGEMIALKTVHKARIMQSKNVATTLMERSLLGRISNPFIVKLICAFQTPAKFYLGLEYVPGGELFFHMERHGRFTKQSIRLYIAEIAVALSYLHSCGVVYRDLKPENVLLDSEGHIKIADFGLSKDISRVGSTASICGTVEYFAPEMVQREAYGFEIDWWALGVMTFEIVFGTTPFHSENRHNLLNNIVKEEPPFPEGTPREVKELITGLLEKDPKKRWNMQNIVGAAFFHGLNFDDVAEKRVEPQFVPEIGPITDISNFDRDFTTEPAMDSYVVPEVGSHERYYGFSYEAPIVESPTT